MISQDLIMENNRLVIRADQLYDGRSVHTDMTVVVEGRHIVDMTDRRPLIFSVISFRI
jgi:hypothetical protein